MNRPIAFRGPLRLGSRGNQVRAVKRGLAQAGFGKLRDSINPLYGPFTVLRMRKYQRTISVMPTGKYGKATHEKLREHFDHYARLLYISPVPLPEPSGGLQLPSSFTPTHQTAGLDGFPAVDVFAKPGTPAKAPEDGYIHRLSGRDPARGGSPGGAYGWNIYLDSSSGRYFMAHWGTRIVVEGQKVRKGQVLGTVCDCAIARMPSSASHIHVGKHVK